MFKRSIRKGAPFFCELFFVLGAWAFAFYSWAMLGRIAIRPHTQNEKMQMPTGPSAISFLATH